MPIAGTYPMLYALFDEGGRLRPDAFAPQVAAARAAGAEGVAVLGLGTETAKLGRAERRAALRAVLEAAEGLPVAATVAETSLPDAREAAREAEGEGAAWVILQPPRTPCPEPDLVRWFAEAALAVSCPVAVQNAPEFLGIGLSPAGIAALAARAPNLAAVKAECPALDAGALVDVLGGRLAVLNGRAGLELTDNARAGVLGMIPGVESVDLQAPAFRLMREGREAEAEALYRRALPLVAFIMQGIGRFVLYGKLVAALRLGLDPGGVRLPGERPTPRGLAFAHRFAAELGPLPT